MKLSEQHPNSASSHVLLAPMIFILGQSSSLLPAGVTPSGQQPCLESMQPPCCIISSVKQCEKFITLIAFGHEQKQLSISIVNVSSAIFKRNALFPDEKISFIPLLYVPLFPYTLHTCL